MTSSSTPVLALALVALASPAAADTVVASANGATVVVSTTAEPPPEPVEREPAALPPVAQPRARNTLAVDALAVLPVGDYANVVDLGIGAGARLEVPAGTGFVTGRVGAVFHTGDFSGRLTYVPAYVGYRHAVGTSGAYLAGELGITFAWATNVITPLGRMSASDSALGMMLAAGLRRGALDLRAGFFTPDLDDAFGLIATAGYDFVAF